LVQVVKKQKKLKGLLEELNKEKLKLEVQSRQTDDDIRETRNKLDLELQKSQDLERTKKSIRWKT